MENLLKYMFDIKKIQKPNTLSYYGDMCRTIIASHRRLPNNQREIILSIFDFIKNDTLFNGNIKMVDLFNELCKEYKPISVLKVLGDVNIIPSYDLTKQILLYNDFELIQYFILFNKLKYLNIELLEMRLKILLENTTKMNLDIFKICCNAYNSNDIDDCRIYIIGNLITLDNINDYKVYLQS